MYRLASDGFRNYTGIFGRVQFENGETSQELTLRQINNIGGLIVLEKVLENGDFFQVGPHSTDPISLAYIKHLVEETGNSYESTLKANDDKVAVVVDEVVTTDSPVASKGNSLFSIEQLEAVADKSGIVGLRELSDPYGIKARSVSEIINALLEITV